MPPLLIERIASDLARKWRLRTIADKAGFLPTLSAQLGRMLCFALAEHDPSRATWVPDGPIHHLPADVTWIEWPHPDFVRVGFLLIASNRADTMTARMATWRPFRAPGSFLIDLDAATASDIEAGEDMAPDAAAAMATTIREMLSIVNSGERVEHPASSRLARQVARVSPGAVLRPWIEIVAPSGSGIASGGN